MEYERIHKVQTGLISPSKLRMKLMGTQHQKKKDGSNSNSSRTSPSKSKLEDSELFKNSLLATNSADFDDEVSNSEVSSAKLPTSAIPDVSEHENTSSHRLEAAKVHILKSDSVNSSSVHPLRTIDDENLDYDSNASSSSFEFHKGEKSLHSQLTRSLSRNMPSKWNDAEKWITNRQNVQANHSKKVHFNNNSQVNRLAVANMGRVVPESSGYDQKLSVKRVDFCHPPPPPLNLENFSFVPSAGNDESPEAESKDLMEVYGNDPSDSKTSAHDTTGLPAIRSVSMRDMGTEMTPIPSQEPSRTATPEGATTPLRSPTSSIPSTPRGGALAANPNGDESQNGKESSSKKELSEQEVKLKTRREIMALGVQLGKMNIAAWASKDEKEKSCIAAEALQAAKLERIEHEKRAAAWEEAEKSKHAARYKREEIKIQAWESQTKAKFEAEMRRLEAQIEQMKAHAQAKMVKKIAMARQKSEEKRTAAEVRKNRDAERTAAQVEQIRQTGRLPSSSPFICCGWLS